MLFLSQSPRWTYLTCAVGFFIYQSLDAIDGKQARRTGSNSPLGELFDHGCDALSTFFVAITGVCALGLQDHPHLLLGFMLLVLELAFFYHWQTYVCGVLHFKRYRILCCQNLSFLAPWLVECTNEGSIVKSSTVNLVFLMHVLVQGIAQFFLSVI